MPEETLPANTSAALLDTAARDVAIDDLLQKGDYSQLTMRERSLFIFGLSKKLGLDPMMKPFDFLVLNNKVTLYANRVCSDQLRQIHNITSHVISEGYFSVGDQVDPDVYCVRMQLCKMSQDGLQVLRAEQAIGCISLVNLKGEAKANAIMKCHTKALRRGTLAFCGLGLPDESEIDSIKSNLQGGVGNPTRIEVTTSGPSAPQESFPAVGEPYTQPAPPMPKPVPNAGPVPKASSAPAVLTAAPKTPAIIPAVKP